MLWNFWILLLALSMFVSVTQGSAEKSPVTAANELASLSENELEYYALTFSYTMETRKDKEAYKWETYSSSGEIIPYTAFTSKQGTLCRPFAEHYTISGNKGSAKGFACRRVGKEGWCRLKEGALLTCALEPPGSKAAEIMRNSAEAVDSGKTTVRGVLERWLGR